MLCSFLFSRLRWRERIFSLFAFIRLFFFHSNISQKKGPSHNCSYYYMVLFFWLLLYSHIFIHCRVHALYSRWESTSASDCAVYNASICLSLYSIYVCSTRTMASSGCLLNCWRGIFVCCVGEANAHIIVTKFVYTQTIKEQRKKKDFGNLDPSQILISTMPRNVLRSFGHLINPIYFLTTIRTMNLSFIASVILANATFDSLGVFKISNAGISRFRLFTESIK